MSDKPRFIRKNGRIIPIFGKSKKQRRKNLDKTDLVTGASVAATSSLFHRRKNFGKKLSYLSVGSGLLTSYARSRNESSVGDFVKEDLGGWAHKAVGAVAGAIGGTAALKGLNKLNKLRKLRKMRR